MNLQREKLSPESFISEILEFHKKTKKIDKIHYVFN